MNPFCKIPIVLCSLVLLISTLFLPALHAENQVLGEVELVGASKVENTSGVWIDGQYVGYLSELKGSKKLLLLPGEHEITVRQGGYRDFVQKVTVRAGEKQSVAVKMEKDTELSCQGLPPRSSWTSSQIAPRFLWMVFSSATSPNSKGWARLCSWPPESTQSK